MDEQENRSTVSTSPAKRPLHLVVECILGCLLAVALCILHFAVPPFNRGFFCNDESIQKPYTTKQAVPANLLLGVGVVLGIVIIFLCELVNYLLFSKPYSFKADEENIEYIAGCKLPAWAYRLFSRIWYFIVGMIITVVFTELGKVMVGRLRPHFLAVCKPNYSLFNCSDGYITIDFCTGQAKQITEARKSFPSGHSSFSAFIAVFLGLYLQYAVRSKAIKLFVPVCQIGLLLLALATALGRISDYFHHWSDVLAGLIIGSLVAFYMIYNVMDLKSEEKTLKEKRIHYQSSGLAIDVENYGAVDLRVTQENQ